MYTEIKSQVHWYMYFRVLKLLKCTFCLWFCFYTPQDKVVSDLKKCVVGDSSCLRGCNNTLLHGIWVSICGEDTTSSGLRARSSHWLTLISSPDLLGSIYLYTVSFFLCFLLSFPFKNNEKSRSLRSLLRRYSRLCHGRQEVCRTPGMWFFLFSVATQAEPPLMQWSQFSPQMSSYTTLVLNSLIIEGCLVWHLRGLVSVSSSVKPMQGQQRTGPLLPHMPH